MNPSLLDKAFPYFSEEDQAVLELIDKRIAQYPSLAFCAIANTLHIDDYDFEVRIRSGGYIPSNTQTTIV